MTTVAAPPLRVVLADDSAESRELLRAMLGSITGVEVIGVAADGRQAVDLLQTMGADVVFLDIAMPMSSLEAAALIRAHHPDLTIIIHSAYDRVAMGLTALAAGADEYFQKAATLGQLVDQLRRVFPGRALHITTSSTGPTSPAGPLPLRRETVPPGAAPAPDPRFRALLDALEQGVLITDPVAVITDANAAATRILHLPLGRVTGHTLTEVGLDDAGVIADGIRSGRRLQHLEYPLQQPDGTTHPVLLTVRPLSGAAGAAPGEYLISLTDPPGRDTERRGRQVLDTAQEGVWSIDTDDVTTCGNARAAALLGDTVPEMVGTPIWEHPAGRPALANGHAARVQGTIVDITEQHRVQEQLRRSEELFRGGFDHSPIGMVLTNLDGTFARVNTSFAGMLGYDDPSELTGVDFASVTHPEDEAGARQGIRRMLAGEPYQAEKRYLRRDGATVHVILSSTAVCDDAGVPIVFFTQVEDITDRKLAEVALADSEHRLRAAFEAVCDGLVVLSPVRVDGEIVDFRFDYINDAGCRLSGMPRERHIGNLISDVLPGFRESGLFDDAVHVVKTGEPVHRQSFFYADVFGGGAPGPRVWDVSLANMGDAVIDTFRDVTDRVAAETQVRQAEERLQSAVASMTDGFFLTRARRDEDGTITDLDYVLVNDAGYRLTGKAPQDLIGHGYVEVWPTAAHFDECCTVVDTGVPFTTVVETPPPAATSTVRVSVTKAGDGCVSLLTDLSERVQHERQLSAAHSQASARAEQLERANRDLEAFASALSHDLREPLRTTAGFVQLITDRHSSDLPEPARELFGYVTAGTERMNERITAILGFARSGASAAPPHPIDSADAAADAARDCQAVLTDAGATLDLGHLPVVAADALQLQRVFQNLITNAAKYTRPGIPPHIATSADRLEDHWQFTVADNGPGVVPESRREQIFAMFVRGGTDDTHDGNGMGLALCRRIIESYGGHIWVEPNPTGGSLFRFTLPTSAEGAATTTVLPLSDRGLR